MKKLTVTTITASALAALSIGLAAPAFAAPSGPSNPDNGGTTQEGNKAGPTTTANSWLDNAGKTPYGTYQNDHTRGQH